MRLFQLITFGAPYLSYFDAKCNLRSDASYRHRMSALLDDRYGNCHLLEPIERQDPTAFLSIADDEALQRTWARENGMPQRASLEDIVIAQIESHRTEVLYNISPLIYDTRFLRRLPSSVKRTVCWRAAPVGGADLSGYDRCVCNFQGLLDDWSRRGWKTAWFEPASDPVAAEYSGGVADRVIDVAFVGGYSRHHGTRNLLLQRIAELSPRREIRFHFSLGRAAKLVNKLGPLRRLAPSLALDGALYQVADRPLYGREMYQLFGSSRIVINAAIDMADVFRGNMRCWEALGCGALMLSDEGVYPPGMQAGRDFETYRDAGDAIEKIQRILADYDAWREVADRGQRTIAATYSRSTQWSAFQRLIDQI